MEGPSLALAREQLKPFTGKRVLEVTGNTTIAKERFDGQVVRELFSWGKHLVFQFDAFALKVHFLMVGTFEADVDGASVTGDYRKARTPRLAFRFANGSIRMYNCSVKILEGPRIKRSYDFSVDVLARSWDPKQALDTLRSQDNEEVADVLLDQAIFSGVGNIIKNEVLSLARIHPQAKVKDLGTAKRKELIKLSRSFSQQFLRWRRVFQLKKNLKVHQKSTCPYCSKKLLHPKTGKGIRRSHYCASCQKLKG
ncbi:MAG: endonuclease [Flavobacteriales bacterium]|nr:endonuclease [Flavobacteriales bacterium]MBK7085718.1 endonuclease [Flavobacteriales bacterium]MBK7268392.1 endonuclease [Flavobacteriales bacterium]MBK7752776.1 endonuclease [Flavobacteriales bacterium]MBK9077485.1 endonuclease [Flavobacteriales bacterium]